LREDQQLPADAPVVTSAEYVAMLQKPGNTLAYYLECLSILQDRTTRTHDEKRRIFQETTCQRWMDLAAAAARAEHVDLFLQSLAFKKVPPMEICKTCYRRMRLETVEATNEGEMYAFECVECGSEKIRVVHNH